jgi:hypothetical protein
MNYLLPFSVGLFVLSGCFSDDKPNPSSFAPVSNKPLPISTSDQSEIIFLDEEAGIMITQSESKDCEDGELVTTTEFDTVHYEITPGTPAQLSAINQGECLQMIYTGDNTGIQGVWTSPLQYQEINSTDCDKEGLSMLENIENGVVTTTVTDVSVTTAFSGDLCLAPTFGDVFANDPDADFEVTDLVVDGCGKISYVMNMAQPEVSIPVSMSFYQESADSDIDLTVVMGDENCKATGKMPPFGQDPVSCDESPFENPEMQGCLQNYIMQNACLADLMVANMEEGNYEVVDCNTIKTTLPGDLATVIHVSAMDGGMVVEMVVEGQCTNTQTIYFDQSENTESQLSEEFSQCLRELSPTPSATLARVALYPLPQLPKINLPQIRP